MRLAAKWLVLYTLAGLALGYILGVRSAQIDAAVAALKPAPDPRQQLRAYYKSCGDCVNFKIMDEAIYHTEGAAVLLCVEDELDTMLSMWVTESHFDPKVSDEKLVGYKNRSVGISQTKRKYFKRLYAEWLKRGVKLGPFSEIKTQVYFGVMEYRDFLGYTRGDVKEAVRAYNGGGRGGPGLVKARRYSDKVMKRRGLIFGRHYVKGETTTLYKECR